MSKPTSPLEDFLAYARNRDLTVAHENNILVHYDRPSSCRYTIQFHPDPDDTLIREQAPPNDPDNYLDPRLIPYRTYPPDSAYVLSLTQSCSDPEYMRDNDIPATTLITAQGFPVTRRLATAIRTIAKSIPHQGVVT